MEFQIKNGDYVPDHRGGLCTLRGADEVLRRVTYRLQARRGGLPFLPELGSQLYRLHQEKPGLRLEVARKYVEQALEQESQVQVKNVALADLGEGKSQLTVWLEWQGETLNVQLTV